MLAAIAFDDDAMRESDEVSDIGTNRLLAAELRTGQLRSPKKAPQGFLRVRGVSTKIAGELSFHGGKIAPILVYREQTHAPPHPSPLPQGEREVLLKKGQSELTYPLSPRGRALG